MLSLSETQNMLKVFLLFMYAFAVIIEKKLWKTFVFVFNNSMNDHCNEELYSSFFSSHTWH